MSHNDRDDENIYSLNKRLTDIDIKLNKILELLSVMPKLDTHIDFITTTYDTIKQPLTFITSSVERLMSSTQRDTLM
jgi:hypothetical protein